MTDGEIPRDENGDVIPHDHPNFGPGTTLIRRVSVEYIVHDDNRDCDRLSSALFKFDDPADHLSCDSTVCIEALDRDPAAWVTDNHWIGSVTLQINKLREIQAETETKVGMVPLDSNQCHGGVWGKITRGRANMLLRASDWLVPISGVAVSDEHEPC